MLSILICVLVFVHTSFINATPHGYGVKSGTAAVANAGAAASAFGDLNAPVRLPAQGSYSGSFSKSSSSSFATSSSSSSAFSYSGSDSNGNSNNCGTGSCLNKESSSTNTHSPNEYSNSQNIAATGNIKPSSAGSNNLINGAKAASGAETVVGVLDNNNVQHCVGSNCPQNECKNVNCNVAPKCISGKCDISSSEQITPHTGTDKKCSSNLCESETKPYQSNTYVNNNCASGQCSGVPPNNRPSSYSSIPKCIDSECASPPNLVFPPNHSNQNMGFPAPASNSKVKVNTVYQKCTGEECDSSKYDETAPVSEIGDIYVNTGTTDFSKSSYDTNIYGDLQDNKKPMKESSSNCNGNGNCVPIKPIFGIVNVNPTPYGPADTPSISINSGSVPVFNKPVIFLTTPKQGSSCTSSNCGSPNTLPGSLANSNLDTDNSYQSNTGFDNKTPNCISGSCAINNSHLTYSNQQTPNYYPTLPENKCNSPICAKPPQSSQNKPALSQPIHSNGIPIVRPILSSVVVSPHNSVLTPQQTGQHSYHFQGSYPTDGTFSKPQSNILNKDFDHHTTLSPIPGLPSNNPFITASSLNNKEPNLNHPSGGNLPAFIPLKPIDPTACGGATQCSYPTDGTSSKPQSNILNKDFDHHTTLSPIPGLPSNNPFITASSLNNKEPNLNQPSGGDLPAFIPLKPIDPTACGGATQCSTSKNPSQNHGPLKPAYPALTPVSSSSTFTPGAINNPLQSEANSHETANKVHNSNDAQYTGTFGGPPGFLKPNDYTPNDHVSYIKPASSSPITGCPFGVCDNKKEFPNSNPFVNQNPSLCGTSNCATHNTNQQSIGNIQSNLPNSAHAATAALASASAGAYTGGFGGPPGFLKPYDDGKISTSLPISNHGKYSSNTQFGASPKNLQIAVSPPLQKVTPSAGAQSFAAAGASAGASANGAYPSSSYEKHGDDSHKTHGCDGGCANGNIGALNLGYSGNFGKSDIGAGAAHAAAHAGSYSGAVSGANAGAFDLGRSFSSSSATAHASAGAAVKGYGRR
ncbi:hypothetical protein ACJJTC_008061 [Scirpophaga incertulas]